MNLKEIKTIEKNLLIQKLENGIKACEEIKEQVNNIESYTCIKSNMADREYCNNVDGTITQFKSIMLNMIKLIQPTTRKEQNNGTNK